MILNTTTIFRMNFEDYPELRKDLRLKVAKKVFDKICDKEKKGKTKVEWAIEQVEIWDSVESDYIPEEYAEYIFMTDNKRKKIIEAYNKKNRKGA